MSKKQKVLLLIIIFAVAAIVIFFIARANSVFPTAALTENDPVVYENNAIEYKYLDVASGSYKTGTTSVENYNSSLKYGLEVIAQDKFGKTLADTPIDPQAMTQQDGNLTIDFKPEIVDSNLGAMGESSILDAIADLYLNNVSGIKAVYFGISGDNFITGHSEIFRNEPYRTKE